ncbi:MFS transporter [Cobetia sp. MB87]|uniref:MFS transporter n=1 Tax=Cobetia sp. MB87 TaxID=2588451 RepID=UPI00140D5F26|nr:MFS transporter [Cobetia sp. MB87]NHH85085.1 putative MFS-type transporter YcaD [Cobetia sp. MB87]
MPHPQQEAVPTPTFETEPLDTSPKRLQPTSSLGAAVVLWSLLLGMGMLMLANGLQGSLLGIRASSEGFSNTMTGIIMSAYFAGFLLGSTLAPRKLRRVGHVRTFAALASITSVCILIHALYVVPEVWIAMRFITGFAFAGLYVVAESWLNSQATNQMRGRLLAIYMVITYLGMGGGQLLLNVANPNTYLLFILVSVIMSLALVPMLLSASPQPEGAQPEAMGLVRLLRLAPLGTLGGFATGIANGTVFGMGAVYADRAGLPVQEVSWFMGAFILGAALLQWPLGKLSDKLSAKKVILGCSLGAIALSIGGVPFSGGSMLTMALLGAGLGGLILTQYSLFLAAANNLLTTPQIISASGTLVLMHGAGAILGPLTAGLLMERFGAVGFLYTLTAIHVLIVILAASVTSKPRQVLDAEEGDHPGHYVVAPSTTSPLSAAWVEEAITEPETGQLEFDFDAEPEPEPSEEELAAQQQEAASEAEEGVVQQVDNEEGVMNDRVTGMEDDWHLDGHIDEQAQHLSEEERRVKSEPERESY